MNANQYALYLRKSRADLDAEARGEGETLAKHRAALQAMAKRRGLLIVREYAELVSGDTIAARPQMQQLLEDVKSGLYSGVIVNDVDRLGRGDSIDQEIIKLTFAASHTLIITPNRDIDPANPSDVDMLDFSMFFARFEYRKISQRMTVGRYRSAAAGHYIHSRVPYGYTRVTVDGGSTLAPDPERAAVVRQIYDWYVSGGYGYKAIAHRLTDMGIPTGTENAWSASRVRDILQSPVYIGTVIYGASRMTSVIEDGRRVKKPLPSAEPVVVEDAHPAIIPRALFDAAQAQRGKTPPVNASREITNPLSGLIICSECGYAMTAHQAYHRPEKYISCQTYKCPTRATRLEDVETALLASVRRYAADYTPPDETPVTGQNKAILERQLETLKKRLARARELVETGVYTPAEYIAQRDELSAQIDAVTADLTAQSDQTRRLVPAAVIAKTIDAYTLTDSAADKNALLKTIIDRVVYTKLARQKRGEPPTLILEIFPVVSTSI